MSNAVLVTGADGGLGTEVVALLRSRGWTVLAWSGRDVDLIDSEATQRAFAGIEQPLHAVVHLVGGIVAGRPVEEMTSSEFGTMIDLNLRTTFNVLRNAIPELKKTSGAIVTIGAQVALTAAPLKSLYAASKSAVHALTLAAAAEGSPHGVRAVCIAPSTIDTAANRSWGTDQQRASWIAPTDIAAEIARCIDPSSTTTGIVIEMS